MKESWVKKSLKNPFVRKGFFTLASFLFLLLVWTIAYAWIGNRYLLPSLSETLKKGVLLLGNKAFYSAFFSTLLRALIAFAFSFLLSAILSIIAYMVAWFSQFITPILSFLRSLPTMAVLLLILLWSTPKVAPIVIACLVLFPMLFNSMLAALVGVDKGLLEMSKVYKVSTKEKITKLYLPSIAPYVCREGATALSFSLKLIVSAEVMSNTFNSLGGKMQTASLYGEIPTLFALVLFCFLCGYLLECIGFLVARRIERRTR